MADQTPDDASRAPSLSPIPFPERDPSRRRLPLPLTSFVGREREISFVADLIRSPGVRLVTLTEPGGVGKTRLAIAVASMMADQEVDQIAFVDLCAVPSGER